MPSTTGDIRPRTWNFDDDGLAVEGTFIMIAVESNAYGSYPVAILRVAGEPRAIWLSHFGLRAGFASELVRRHARNFKPGERVTIERSAEKQHGRKNSFWAYEVLFPDAEPTDDATILGVDDDSDILALIESRAA